MCMCDSVSSLRTRCQTTGYYMPPAREIRSTKQTTTTPIRTQTLSEIHTHWHTHTYTDSGWGKGMGENKSKSKSPKAFGARKYMLHLIGMISSVKYDFSLHLSKGAERGGEWGSRRIRLVKQKNMFKGKKECLNVMRKCGKIISNE